MGATQEPTSEPEGTSSTPQPTSVAGNDEAASFHPTVAYNPQPVSFTDRQAQRALRRLRADRRTLPTWAKRLGWVLAPFYGFQRLADPDFKEHADQWRQHQRDEYGDR